MRQSGNGDHAAHYHRKAIINIDGTVNNYFSEKQSAKNFSFKEL